MYLYSQLSTRVISGFISGFWPTVPNQSTNSQVTSAEVDTPATGAYMYSMHGYYTTGAWNSNISVVIVRLQSVN